MTVVFTEGADFSPQDWGSVSEVCEIRGTRNSVCAAVGRLPERVRRLRLVRGEGYDLIGR